jgi:predicted  nucleic acid-binding Zn-ribbon protein
MHKCIYCGRFYNRQKDDKMCKECKSKYEVTFQKLKNNKALQEVMLRLADR